MKNKKFIINDINEVRLNLKRTYDNKYYNMFIHQFKWNGLTPEESDYVMRCFWDKGTVAAFKVKHTDKLAYTAWATQKWNMYDFPEEVTLINKWSVPFMPMGVQVVNKDVVLGWIQANHKGIRDIVDKYIERMVEVDMVIHTNLQTHKLPFLINVKPEDVKKAQDVVDRILNDEPVIFMDTETSIVETSNTNTPYIIDKLYAYRTSIENELLTYLGIDNSTMNTAKERMLVDEVNANNEVINQNQQTMLANLEAFTQHIQEVFGITITVEPTVKPVESIYENGDVNEEEVGGKDENN